MFKTGRFYAVSATSNDGRTVYLEEPRDTHASKLRAIAKKTGYSRYRSSPFASYGEEDDEEEKAATTINHHGDPFKASHWPVNSTKLERVVEAMRKMRPLCGASGINPMSLKIVTISTAVENYVPEDPSDEATLLRSFILDKLTEDERRLLKVEHWNVYAKLSSRSDKDEDEEDR